MAIDKNQDDPEQKARASTLRLLARREHSRQELSLKLRQRQTPDSIINLVLDEYEQEGWLSNERFADVYGRQRRDLGYGPVRIRSELQQRGVRLWPDCLGCMTEADWVALAVRTRQKKFGLADIGDDWTEKARQARFLGQRGYSGEQVEQALEVRSDVES